MLQSLFKFFKVFSFLGVVFLTYSLHAEDFSGRVVSVHDGDTIRVLDGKHQKKVRLFGIDAPESNQAFGKVSENTLKDLIWKKNVRVEFKEKDQYGRMVGVIYLENQNINLEMVKRGMAWVYRTYNKESVYLEAEEIAKKSGIGLWKDKNPTPPWRFRRSEKEQKSKR